MLTVFSVVLMLGGGLALFLVLAPRGTKTEDGEHTDFSTEERLRAVAIGALLLIHVELLRQLGLKEETGLGGIVLGIVGLPILFLLFIAAFGRLSRD